MQLMLKEEMHVGIKNKKAQLNFILLSIEEHYPLN